jgi:hypothetical protein
MVVITMEWEVGSSCPMEGKTSYQDAWQYTSGRFCMQVRSHNSVSVMMTCEAP